MAEHVDGHMDASSPYSFIYAHHVSKWMNVLYSGLSSLQVQWWDFSIRHRYVQTDPEAHPASYPMGTGCS